MRLTREVRQQILDQNEGFTKVTSYEGKNSEETRYYKISCGQLNIRAVGKTSWSDSRYDNEWTADDDEVHSFLYRYKDELDLSGIE